MVKWFPFWNIFYIKASHKTTCFYETNYFELMRSGRFSIVDKWYFGIVKWGCFIDSFVVNCQAALQMGCVIALIFSIWTQMN